MTEDRDWAAEHDALLPRLEEARGLLAHFPGVVSVDLGIKEVGGELTSVLAFRAYVSRKLPESELAADARIPSTVLGVPTDVIEYTTEPSLHGDVVQGGTLASTGGCLSAYGTLGCIATRTSDNKTVILSNQHVFESVGEQIGQPGCICLCCACGKIADVTAVQEDGSVDCGIALLRDGVHASNVIKSLNDDGTDGSLQGSANAVVNGSAKKVGVGTGKTTGTIVSITHKANPKTNQILIKPTSTFTRFDDHGDSGAVVVDSSNQVVGLIWAGYDTGAMFGQTVACPIAAVTTAMGISIISGSFQHLALVGGSGEGRAVQDLSPQEALVELRAIAKAAPAGRELIALVAEHHTEIVGLVNENRRVMIAWHRGHGPTWLAALVRSARVDSYVLPEAIEGVSRSEFIGAMRMAIEQACSEELREALSRHADGLTTSFCTAPTVRAMIGKYCAADAFRDKCITDPATAEPVLG